MDPLRLICEQDGFFTRAMADDVGYDDKAVAFMVRARIWTRFRRGFYSFSDIWQTLDETGRHVVRCRAVLHSLGDAVALSHVSGVVAHGIATWGIDLSRVHVTRLDGGAGRLEGDVVHHEGTCSESDVMVADGMRVLSPVRCAIECGTRTNPEMALCVFDSLLHTGKSDQDELMRQFVSMSEWPGTRRLHVPVRMADGRADGIGESRGRWTFWLMHLPAPELQYEVRDGDGVLRGTCDWAWPERRTLGEFDGEVTYGRLLKPGQDPGQVVFAEKQREDELRELTGYSMVRLVWSDYGRPRLIRARLLRLFRQAG